MTSIFSVVFPILFVAMFLLFLGIFVTILVIGLSRWRKNNRSPRLTVSARVIAKRAAFSGHHHHTNSMHTSYTTQYYATFQVAGGDRMELYLPESVYGLLVEGDEGQLTFQGTRFLDFTRTL